MTGNGALADLDGLGTKGNVHAIVLGEAEAEFFFKQLVLGCGFVIEWQAALVALQRRPLNQINGAGIAMGKLPRLGQNRLQQLAAYHHLQHR